MAGSSMAEDFESFYSRWLVEQQAFLDQLIVVSGLKGEVLEQGGTDRCIGALIEEVLSHYKRYYEKKAKAMGQEDELGWSLSFLFSQENEFLWMGGFKPSFALSLLEASVNDMTQEQKGRVEVVRREVEAEEKAVEEVKEERSVMWAQTEMREVIGRADRVRRDTVMRVVESLGGQQTVKFLVAVGSYWLGMKSLGVNFPL